MKWTEVPSGQVNAATQRLLVAMGDEADIIIGKINADERLAPCLMELATTIGSRLPVSYERARQIMGDNFFGTGRAAEHFEFTPSAEQGAFFSEVPFPEETLVACRDTHVLVAVFPMSILDIRDKVAKMKLPFGQKNFFYNDRFEQDWYSKEAFAQVKGELGWQLVRRMPVDNSNWKTWDEQQALLGKDEKTPTAQVMVYTVIAFFLASGKRLFEGGWVRCSDSASGGAPVYVGRFVADGLRVNGYWGGRRHDIGVSSAWKQKQ